MSLVTSVPTIKLQFAHQAFCAADPDAVAFAPAHFRILRAKEKLDSRGKSVKLPP
jgi:hypothetical protein